MIHIFALDFNDVSEGRLNLQQLVEIRRFWGIHLLTGTEDKLDINHLTKIFNQLNNCEKRQISKVFLYIRN